MKTAISIPDPIFQSAEKLARRLGVSRSELYAKAVSEYLEDHIQEGVTEKLNALYGKLDSGLEAGHYAMQYHSLEDEAW